MVGLRQFILLILVVFLPNYGMAQAPARMAPERAPTARIGGQPDNAPKVRFPRGATPGSRRIHRAFELTKDPRFSHQAKAVPAQWVPATIPTPAQMSMWGNSQYGDCVTAEEFFAKCIYPVWYSASGTMLDMPESLAISWATANGYLNGADLTPVMDSMAKPGVVYNTTTYTDGPYTSVDYTTWATLISAINTGPVKIGIASSQFDNVTGVGQTNGWVMTGFTKDTNEDHCVALLGYGTMSYLATAMGITLPAGVDGTANGCLLYTWDTIGLIDFTSMNNVTGEAWLRSPTTPQTPPPTPNPTPTPTSVVYTLVSPPAGATVDASGNFTWVVPAAQATGPVTFNFTVSTGLIAPAKGSFVVTVSATPTPTVTIAPIPDQVASAGATLTVPLSQYVTVTTPKK
jgi:hypothetical protein